MTPRVVVLAGGVGGARFSHGLVRVVPPAEVLVVGNVGDDFEPYGLPVSPDLDTVLYTLAGRIDDGRGWGVDGDTTAALETAALLGDDAWFVLGDRDLGLHLARAERLRRGEPLSAATAALARALGLETQLLPATDDRLRTILTTPTATSSSRSTTCAAGTPTRCSGCASTAPSRPGRRPAWSRPSPAPRP